ncbi:MAG TPA: penicillin acylase family protein [Candidatus Margulisiibacteriota bacterium]|nr:penicillin acylase family protein [Candidatus Margulisiibacteriota bacterium]
MKRLICSLLGLTLLAAIPARAADLARYILPPGNFGGLPATVNSTDQLPLYSGLSPLRGNITPTDLDTHYLPEDFQPIGATQEEMTGRAGVQILYDSYGIPHITGQTRDDLSFGAGWVTARDRGLLLLEGRGPARVAVADVPNIDAFSLVTSLQTFTPSADAEALVTQQVQLIQKTYGKKKGTQIIADAQAYADGINAYNAAHNINQPQFTVNDVVAVTAFIGSIFGAGGGGEAANSDLLAKLKQSLGDDMGSKAWSDVMLADDPEAPTTISKTFKYPVLTGGKAVTGSVTLDAGSIESIDPRIPAAQAGLAPARLRASNFLAVAPSRSATGNALTVMGPQLGYYYPEIVQQIHLQGAGINVQGVGVPGLAMYILIGRTADYAWSLTSAGHDVRDVFAEELCEPDGSTPTRASTHYVFKKKCIAMSSFNAGTLGTTPLIYNRTVHGSVFATATVGGKPYALSLQRSTFGRDGLNLGALKDMTEGVATTPSKFWKTADQFGFTFNWAWVSRKQGTAYFSSGYLPKRAKGLDRRLPTLGNGTYEWKGFLSTGQHPHDVTGPDGLLLNWNNRSAPGFMHGDDEPYGSEHRVQMFNKFPQAVKITDDVGVMNRAATQDVRSPVWPFVSRVLKAGTAPNARDQQIVDILDDWVGRDAPRVDANSDTFYDEPGPVIMDAIWRPIVEAVMSPVFGALIPDLDNVRGLDAGAGTGPGLSYVHKDLRTLLGDPVEGPFQLSYCGRGNLSDCSASLWQAIHVTADSVAAQQAQTDPHLWRKTAAVTRFVPNLIPNTFPTTNRSTFQQVIEFDKSAR